MWVHDAWRERGILAAMSGEAEGDCGWEGVPSIRDAAFAPSGASGASGASIHLLRQVHGVELCEASGVITPSLSKEDAPEADGWILARSTQAVGILVADCVPVWIVDAEARVGAVLHAGREGTRRNIVQAAVTRLVQQCNLEPARLEAYIGPSAGPCCYEVSEEMAEAWRQQGLVAGGRKLDLWQSNCQQLLCAGLDASKIGQARHCTVCMKGYYSYRASGTMRRNLALLQFSGSHSEHSCSE